MKRLAVLVVAVFVGCSGQTDPATNIDQDSATLNGRVSCDTGESGMFWFEIDTPGLFKRVGLTRSYNCSTALTNVPVTQRVTGLRAGRVHKFRLAVDPGPQDGNVVYGDADGAVRQNPQYDWFITKATGP